MNTPNIQSFWRVALVLLAMLAVPALTLWAQEQGRKFGWTTQMFLEEQMRLTEAPAPTPRRAPPLPPSREMARKPHRLIASPDTVGGIAYISCFIHLNDVNDLTQVTALGVEVEETFDGLDFITARVPVKKLQSLAAINNVTSINVAQLMQPYTDVARQKTNADDILTRSDDAAAQGINSKFDGAGVVLGIIDTGIDFQHIAFKDKDGNSRIKMAYVYDGTSAREYSTITATTPTTDNNTMDHGTHTATTAGGSSVIVSGGALTVTDDHANATYGGMAPAADLYLAGFKNLSDTYMMNALKKMVAYADQQGKPLVVSNSWGSGFGPHDGTGEWADIVGQYFGDNHPGRIILFASSNDAGHSKDNEGGGFFVKKSEASSDNPLATILRSATYNDCDGGFLYQDLISSVWSSKKLACRLYVLDSSTGAVLKSWTVTNSTSSFSELNTYYDGSLAIYIEQTNGKHRLMAYSNDGIRTKSYSGTDSYKSKYTLAMEVYPSSGSAEVNMWAGNYSYFTNHLSTPGHTWMAGIDDMCVSDEATIPDAISVGAYVSKSSVTNYRGSRYNYNSGTLGDIATFSSYATAEQSPTGETYPWITAPGAQVVAGVNHYHTASVDNSSYFSSANASMLVVNDGTSPYGVMQGTSMSTPVAAGIVALWLQAARSVGKDLTVNEVKNIMAQTAISDSYTTGSNASHFGHGKIDALTGIHYILNTYNSKVSVESISLNYTALTMNSGDQLQLTASVLPANATDKSVSFTSSNEAVVTVSTSGLLNALSPGTAVITCTANDGSGIKASCEVSVTINQYYPVPYFVSVTCENDSPLQLRSNDMLQLKATIGNRGASGNISTMAVVLSNDGSMSIVQRNEEQSQPFASSQEREISHTLSLAGIPEGDYYATVLFYKDSDDEDEAGWYYNRQWLIDIHTGPASERGDVNGDGEVNGTDLVVLTNIILEVSEDRPAADVNGDGEVNGTDFVVLVNIILQRSNSRTGSATVGIEAPLRLKMEKE